MADRPFIIAHQGASKTRPPNTMPAFEEAWRCGADMIELDVVCTLDGVVVVSHNLEPKGCPEGHARIPDLTLSEVERCDVGADFGAVFAGTRMPRLEQVLDWAKTTGMRLCIEVKGDSDANSLRTAQATIAVLQQRAALQPVTLTSFNPTCIRVMRMAEPRLAWGLDPDEHRSHSGWELVQQVLGCGATFLLHRHDTLTDEIVVEAHAHGFAVWAWTADEPVQMRRLIAQKVDGIMTNRPDVLAGVLAAGQDDRR
jgi:glycerophosphoryl diester phosphodiesterase